MEIKNILLVEDDELDVISVERSLRKLDQPYELKTAYNGIEALEVLHQSQMQKKPLPDIILLDLNMPKMNGIEFLKELRKEDELKHLKVFVMTTSGDEADRRATEQMGVSGYVIKPLNFNNNDKRTDSLEGFFQFHLRNIISKSLRN